VTGNVATGNTIGIQLQDTATVTDNATFGNGGGFAVSLPFMGLLAGNNIFGNADCGILVDGVAGVVASNNYWGAPTGPGPRPADAAGPGTSCDENGAATTITPFASKPFKVKAPLKL